MGGNNHTVVRSLPGKTKRGRRRKGILGHKFCLQLHLCRPFECNIHQQLKSTKILVEVWWGWRRSVEEPTLCVCTRSQFRCVLVAGEGVVCEAAGRGLLHVCGLTYISWLAKVERGVFQRSHSRVANHRRPSQDRSRGSRLGRGQSLSDRCGRGKEGSVLQQRNVVLCVDGRLHQAALGKLGPSPRDSELVWVFAILPQHVR